MTTLHTRAATSPLQARHRGSAAMSPLAGLAVVGLACVLALPSGCSTYRDTGGETAISREQQADRAIADFRTTDPGIERFFQSAHAWAVFPEIGKGGAIIGGAAGDGVVYQGGRIVGYSTMRQVTVGAQIGGQSYSQIIFFQDAPAFARFRENRTDFAANASAVIARSGAAATNDYNQGLAIFVRPLQGVMAEAAIGGQKFEFRPK